jgi:hypothetical protein
MRFSPMARLTARTDENAHYYNFIERLPHINLTRVGIGVQEAPLDWEQLTPNPSPTKYGRLAAMQLL